MAFGFKPAMAGGFLLAGFASVIAVDQMPQQAHEIRMISDQTGADVWFDPVGIWVEPRQIVRWILVRGVHTATAYHPDNAKPLRVPPEAASWDSGYLTDEGESFDVRFTREGVYDYFCAPHELAGMVGRIVVGNAAAGPIGTTDSLPRAARSTLPSVERIVAERVVGRSGR